ncbi:hypothetical protein DAEQUDRAFT_69394 [Daedalea quercina L-15889]|uniref:C2H2-type domain-containing protein n=1 Tax=Daedalea quercina L-15889 TaxID=1314783 RepID=A0A165L6F0_9APHY|nr:hypothetical protein DAEQUDRAFT_69394 [Daedalea quercina L-15889]
MVSDVLGRSVHMGDADETGVDRTDGHDGYINHNADHYVISGTLGLSCSEFGRVSSTAERVCERCGRRFYRYDAYQRHLREGCPGRF